MGLSIQRHAFFSSFSTFTSLCFHCNVDTSRRQGWLQKRRWEIGCTLTNRETFRIWLFFLNVYNGKQQTTLEGFSIKNYFQCLWTHYFVISLINCNKSDPTSHHMFLDSLLHYDTPVQLFTTRPNSHFPLHVFCWKGSKPIASQLTQMDKATAGRVFQGFACIGIRFIQYFICPR